MPVRQPPRPRPGSPRKVPTAAETAPPDQPITSSETEDGELSAREEEAEYQPDGVEQYDNEDFEKDTDDEHGNEASNDEEDNTDSEEGNRPLADQTVDRNHKRWYNTKEKTFFAERRTDVVFHGLQESRNRTDRELIQSVLAYLGVDPNEYIEEVERFGNEDTEEVRPIRVKIKSVEKAKQILRLGAELVTETHTELNGINIEPFLTRDQLDERRENLRRTLQEYRSS